MMSAGARVAWASLGEPGDIMRIQGEDMSATITKPNIDARLERALQNVAPLSVLCDLK